MELVIEWNRLLADPKALALVEKMLTGRLETLRPSIDREGGIVYRDAIDALGNDASQTLDTLVRGGVLERTSESRILACPSHPDSLDLSPRLKCPSCNSMLLRKGTLDQHNCGFMGAREVFSTSCPKCGRPSPPQTLRLMGSWYECDADKNRFASPNVYLFCRKFNHEFPVQDALLVDQASYKLTRAAAKDLNERLGIVLMTKWWLQVAGYDVKTPGTVKGVSGVQHSFDILLQKGENSVPVDIKMGSEGPIGVAEVLATYAKALDTKSSPSVLVAVPSASEDARRSVSSYGMLLVEGSDPRRISQGLVSAVQKFKAEAARAAPAA